MPDIGYLDPGIVGLNQLTMSDIKGLLTELEELKAELEELTAKNAKLTEWVSWG